MSDLVERAKAFALKAHGEQQHGSVPISQHLEAVAGKAEEEVFKYFDAVKNKDTIETILAAAWLHDTLEDTTVTYGEIHKEFGTNVAEVVYDVTDGSGKNRLERHLNTYYRTRENYPAIFVKMCDRWHNQKRSTEKAERFMEMYHREYLYFKFALYIPGMYADFWKELDAQYEAMDKIIKAR